MTNLEWLANHNNCVWTDWFCAHVYFAKYGKRCNDRCKNCPMYNSENVIHAVQEEHDDLIIMKVFLAEKEEKHRVKDLEYVLRRLNKELWETSDEELLAIYDYYGEGVYSIDSEIIRRSKITVDTCDIHRWSDVIQNALEILRCENN